MFKRLYAKCLIKSRHIVKARFSPLRTAVCMSAWISVLCGFQQQKVVSPTIALVGTGRWWLKGDVFICSRFDYLKIGHCFHCQNIKIPSSG